MNVARKREIGTNKYRYTWDKWEVNLLYTNMKIFDIAEMTGKPLHSVRSKMSSLKITLSGRGGKIKKAHGSQQADPREKHRKIIEEHKDDKTLNPYLEKINKTYYRWE